MLAVIGGGIMAAALVALSRLGRRADRQIAELRASAVDIARANVPGRVVLAGRVVRGEALLRAPYSSRECAFYTVVAVRGKGMTRDWAKQLEIEDHSGRARIDLKFAEVDLSGAAVERVSLGIEQRDAPGTSMSLLAKAREHLLQPGDRVLVAGFARSRELDPRGTPSGGGVFREAPARIVVEGSAEAPVIVRFRK